MHLLKKIFFFSQFCSLLSLFTLPSYAQAPGCPSINAGNDVNINCNACTTLTSTVLQTGQTNSYAVSSVPYTPFSYNTGNSVIIGIDDIWSATISIPFNFCFFGSFYNKLKIGSNELITFNLNEPSFSAGGCEWNLQGAGTIPNSSIHTNTIMGPYQDIDPTYQGLIKWLITGTAPCRMFIVSFYQVPYYGDPNSVNTSSCNGPLYATSQIVLYETTNVIEIYIANKEICPQWNSGLAILGIQNSTGSAGYAVPGRNNTVWTASNEAWRFTPNGIPNFTVDWYNQTNNSLAGSGLTASVCPTSTTNYIAQITYTNCDGAQVIKKDTVTVNLPGGFTAAASQINPNCNICNGNMDVAITGGTAPFTFNIGSGNQASGNFSNLCAGNYTVSVTDSMGCTGTVSVSLPAPPALTIIPSQTNVACYGDSSGSASVTTGGGTTPFSFLWNDGVQTNSHSLLQAGNYTVTVTDSAGCSSVETFNITQPAVLSLIPSQTDVTCNSASDGAASVTVSGGVFPYSYLWNDGVQTNPHSSLQAGNYAVTITDSSGCTSIQTFNIIQTDPLIVTASQTNVLCNGNSTGSADVNITGGTTPYSYMWNDGTQTNGISSLQTGNYVVTVTDGNNCTEVQNFTITEPPALSLSVTIYDVTCYSDCNGTASSNSNGGVIPYAYQWSNGQISDSVNALCAGVYTLLVIDSNSCVISETFIVSEPQPFSILDTSVNANCGQYDGSAAITVAGAISPYSYLWFDGVQTNIHSSLQTGNHCVTITDADGCDTTVCIFVGDNDPPVTYTNSTAVSCYGDCNGMASAIAIGGNPQGTTYTFLWSYANNGSWSATGDTIANLCQGAYTVTVTDEKNCTATDVVAVSEPLQINVAAAQDTQICIGTDAFLFTYADGGSGTLSFLWSNGDTTDSPTVSPNAATCYSVFATDANNCSSPIDTQCVSFYPPMNVTASAFPLKICNGDTVNLSANAAGGKGQPYKYTWLNVSGVAIDTVKQLQHKPTEYPNATTYIVIASDLCSPDDTASVTINFYENPEAGFTTTDTAGCEPLPVLFVNQSSPFNNLDSCFWNFGDGSALSDDTSLIVQHSFINAGSYTVQLTVKTKDGNNCRDSIIKTKYIQVNPLPDADFGANPYTTNVQNMLIEFADLSYGKGNNITKWQWMFYDNDKTTLLGADTIQNPEFNFSPVSNLPDWWFIYFLNDTGDFPVTLHVTSENNCSDTIRKNIHVGGVYNMNIPNAFTPNDDELNDYFFPVGVGILPEENFTFYVFDRWGDVVFKSTNLNNPWDGKNRKGKTVSLGVYVWRLDLETITGEQKKIIGRVTVAK